MKKYLLFSYTKHYPLGGWEDFVGDFDTVEQAKNNYLDDFAHIVDTASKKIVHYYRSSQWYEGGDPNE